MTFLIGAPASCRHSRGRGSHHLLLSWVSRWLSLASLSFSLAGFALPATGGGTPPVSSLLMEGSRQYQEGRWEKASDAFLQARQTGLRNADLEFDMGNAAFRLGRKGEAMLGYERALWLDPGHADALFNRDYLRHLLVDKVQEAEPSLPSRVWEGLRAVPGLNGLGWILLFGFTSSCAASAIYADRRFGPSRRRWLSALVACLALVLVSGTLFAGMAWQRETAREGVVLAASLDVRSGPSDTNPVLFTVHEGLLVELAADARNWVQVVLPNGWNGWVPHESVGAVQD